MILRLLALSFFISASLFAQTSKNSAYEFCPLVIDFNQSMGRSVAFGYNDPNDHVWYEFWQSLYNQNNLAMVTPAQEPIIPKIIHHIWLGSPLPEEYRVLIETWRTMHPDWVHMLWTDESIKNIKLYNQDLFDLVNNYGQKSDILRYEILYNIGGLYLDIDFRCLKPHDIFHHCYDFYIGICNTGTVDLGIGLIGARPGHPILKQVITSMRPTKRITSYDDILKMTGNVHFMKSFMAIAPTYDQGKIITFPCSFFYPTPNSERFKTQEEMDVWIQPESFATHYWSCSWQKPAAFVKK